MPLSIEHRRNNETISYRWGMWHLWAFITACDEEGVKLVEVGKYTFHQPHTFTDKEDGEVLTIEPGDTIDMWRSF